MAPKGSQLQRDMKISDAFFEMEISKLNINVSQMFNKINMSLADFTLELSQLKTNVSQLSIKVAMLEKQDVELKKELADLRNKFLVTNREIRSILADLMTEISKLKKGGNYTEPPGAAPGQEWDHVAPYDIQILQVPEEDEDCSSGHGPIKCQCPAQWKRFRQSCYYFSSVRKSGAEAGRSCATNDAYLVVINGAEEQMFIRISAQNTRYWIGLNDTTSEGDWCWADGTDYSSNLKFWRTGEPNNQNDEDCVVMEDTGEWNDEPCHTQQYWICEKSAQPLP
ncbi:C-type lectin domain family 4 member E-like [Carcharodon carcharias]|uniref:C-type lectin domain family 4 member E-like n=1 Tax=Carcharodon carcharias TaxID=13397 RepID=UPI001B7E4B00|nr:C-type lectin domain family 4 member E-like [Carcharodon carcharias]